jgi:hypothetical protein
LAILFVKIYLSIGKKTGVGEKASERDAGFYGMSSSFSRKSLEADFGANTIVLAQVRVPRA